MTRTTLFALAAVAALATAPALAQTAGPGGPGAPGADARPAAVAIDRSALIDARIAAIRAGLRLTSEQEPLFAPVADAIRAAGEARLERREAMRGEGMHGRGMRGDRMRGDGMRRQGTRGDAASADFMQRLERYSARAGERASEVSGVASAVRPLWDSLDEGQQALLPVLMRETRMSGRGGRHRG